MPANGRSCVEKFVKALDEVALEDLEMDAILKKEKRVFRQRNQTFDLHLGSNICTSLLEESSEKEKGESILGNYVVQDIMV